MDQFIIRLVYYYGAIAIATTIFFWIFTIIGYREPELRENCRKHNLSLTTALLLGVEMGLKWPKSMLGVLLSLKGQ